MVMDTLMLYIFTVVFIVGTLFIIRTPYSSDDPPPLSMEIATKPLGGDTIEFGLKDSNYTHSNYNFQ